LLVGLWLHRLHRLWIRDARRALQICATSLEFPTTPWAHASVQTITCWISDARVALSREQVRRGRSAALNARAPCFALLAAGWAGAGVASICSGEQQVRATLPIRLRGPRGLPGLSWRSRQGGAGQRGAPRVVFGASSGADARVQTIACGIGDTWSARVGWPGGAGQLMRVHRASLLRPLVGHVHVLHPSSAVHDKCGQHWPASKCAADEEPLAGGCAHCKLVHIEASFNPLAAQRQVFNPSPAG